MVELFCVKVVVLKKGDKYGDYELDYVDDFEYIDFIDGFVFKN